MMNWSSAAAVILTLFAYNAAEGIGVNWGTQAAQNLQPATVVQLLKDNKIDKIKLFDYDPFVVSSLAGTGIDVMIAIPNNELQDYANNYDAAADWVQENVLLNLQDGVKMRYVAVGNEPFLKSYNGTFENIVFPALKNIQKALNAQGIGDKVKATIPQNADVYDTNSGSPSSGNFRSDIRDTMVQIVQFLRDNNSPFLVNIYPFLSLYENPNFPIAYAFFEGGAQPIRDKGTTYTNMVDANFDSLVWSLRKANSGKVKIIIGEIGWPTDGHDDATADMAKKFYDGWFKKMASKKGTPMYPGEIEYYLFSLTDENLKSIAPGDFERHWGMFQYDGQPKFPMDFTGKGNDRWPVPAKNVTYRVAQWCVLDPEMYGAENVGDNMNFACSFGDCTPLNHANPCAKMNQTRKASYAFNIYYQMNNQAGDSCDFEGLGKIVVLNASTDQCDFPIALKSAATAVHGGGILFLAAALVVLSFL
ncbi:hypothetical protein M569_10642, partial [Genlisea aurea]